MVNGTQKTAVAVIGIGCIFPASGNAKEYWRLLYLGEDAITEVPDSHWSPEDYFDEDPKREDHVYCKRGGFISATPFDPSEFGIPPASLEATDSAQLLGLVAAKMAIEDAGYGPRRKLPRDRTSVILGVTGTQELVIPLSSRLGHPIWRRALADSGIPPEKAGEIVQKISDAYVPWQENSFPGLLGNVVAGRISNRLDLGGTNCVVDAACASSLSAVHLSMMELSTGRCDLAVTGGVDTLNDIFMHMCFAKSSVLSPTGDARPFSKNADGTVLGEGIGILVLKRLDEAEADRDRIYAVIRGIGSASDGKSQSIYAPSAEGQARALKNAYRIAGVDPATVELVEAHGTGTRVGDAVEFRALKEVFGENGARKNGCALGSVKSMIGHTKAAAGSAGLIKGVLALHHKVLPPTLKIEGSDPELDIEGSPFYLNTVSRPWFSSESHPRRCGVSAFGFGGSNYHAVLEEHRPIKTPVSWNGTVEIFALSASIRSDLSRKLRELASDLSGKPSNRKIASRAAGTRHHFSAADPHRILFVLDRTRNRSEDPMRLISRALEELERDETDPARPPFDIFRGRSGAPGRIAFLFPGQGSQYVGMGKDLICTFPEGISVLEELNRKTRGDVRFTDHIYPAIAPGARGSELREETLRRTEIAQPAIGAVSAAMGAILNRFGITPDAACGHSFGELTALFAAGWIDLQAFFALSLERGRLMSDASRKEGGEKGAMLAVIGPLHALEDLLEKGDRRLVLANRNSPEQGVFSGSEEAVREIEAICRQRGYRTKILPVSTAFHSSFVRDAKKPFDAFLETVSFHPTPIPVISNATAAAYPEDAEAAKRALGEQLIRPVDFLGQIEHLYRDGFRTFIEVGPKNILTGLVRSILKTRDILALALDESAGKKSGVGDLARLLCSLASAGYPVDLEAWEDPVAETDPPRMSIPIRGANYRSQPKLRKKAAAGSEPKIATASAEGTSAKDTTMEKEKKTETGLAVEALRTVQEGIRSMQAIQLRTAEAHQKFLETQAEAGRALQEMMRSTRRFAEAAIGIPATGMEKFETVIEKTPETAPAPSPGRRREEAAKPPAIAAHSRVEANENEIGARILEIVAELTGYPVEMLGLDMEIEGDLGIDSIKRVEILSVLGERMPGLPAVSPEEIGKLKTLGQIVRHLEGGDPPASFVAPAAADASGKVNCSVAGEKRARTEGEAPGREEMSRILCDVVGELTGYPAEMLGNDMDIEADLGIDSIKRVEILSVLGERVPELPGVSPEAMGRLKTLGQISDYLCSGLPAHSTCELPCEALRTAGPVKKKSSDPAPAGSLKRKSVVLRNTRFMAGRKRRLPSGASFCIAGGDPELSSAVAAALNGRGIETVSIRGEEIPRFLSEGRMPQPIGGLLLLAGGGDETAGNPYAAGEAFLRNAFEIARRFGEGLAGLGSDGEAVFGTLSRIDGAFGFKGGRIFDPYQGGLAGLLKTAALEWENVFCRAIDVDPSWSDNDGIAGCIATELMEGDPEGPVEIGLGPEIRHTLGLEAHAHSGGKLDLRKGDVVVISGGARGITAAASMGLALRAAPTLVLIGRSPHPAPEPEWLAPLVEESAVKRAIIAHRFERENPSPAQVEKIFREITAGREIAAALKDLRSTGASIHYYTADVRDEARIASILEEVRSSHGPVRAIIHAAGVVEDRLILSKTPEQFQKVFSTKVKGFEALMRATRNDPLRYIVVFSSVAARFGNRGQSDYAMANEVLNKMARNEFERHGDCRVVSINWGPWDGGMVTPGLRQEFIRSGIELIPIEEGVRSLIEEMEGDPGNPVEIVIGADIARRKSSLSLSFKREIDLRGYPILEAHIIDGKPVVPFALFPEWFGHGALHENPGLILHGIDDMRLLNGIKLDREKRTIRLFTGKPRKKGAFYEVDVEIRDGVRHGAEVIHSRAKAILTDKPVHPPIYRKPASLGARKYGRDLEEAYEKILFHGFHLRGIREVIGYSSEGMIARLSCAPPPERWIAEPMRRKWIGDPLVLDCAFQMSILWGVEVTGSPCLPIYGASYRQYRENFPADEVTAVLEVTGKGEHKLKGDFTFLDAAGGVVARLTGYEAVIDPAIRRAFRPSPMGR